MDQYFNDFIKKLGLAEEKLDILSEWHLAQKQQGATEIAEDCRCAISALWLEFYGLVEEYNREKEHHEAIKQQNIDYLFSELEKVENYVKSDYAPQRLKTSYFLDLLNEVADQRSASYKGFCVFGTDAEKESTTKLNLWVYLRGLVERDLSDKEAAKHGN